jgi:hypothetical protein
MLICCHILYYPVYGQTSFHPISLHHSRQYTYASRTFKCKVCRIAAILEHSKRKIISGQNITVFSAFQKRSSKNERSEALTAVLMKIQIFGDVTLYWVVEIYKNFGATLKMEALSFPKASVNICQLTRRDMQQTRIVKSYIIMWYCRVLPTFLQTFDYYFSRTTADLPDLYMTVCVREGLQISPELFIAARCVRHTATASFGHLTTQTSSERFCPVSIHYHKPALGISIEL